MTVDDARHTVNIVIRGPGLSGDGMITGFVDDLLDLQLTGWAADEDDYGQAVEIVVYADGVEIARSAADRFRPDLQASGIGEGRHAFEIPIPPQYRMARLRVLARTAAGEAELPFLDRDDRMVVRVVDAVSGRFEPALQQLRRDQKALARALEDDRGRSEAAVARSDGVLERLAALEKRLDDAEVFLMRIDSNLRKLSEGTARPRRRGLFGLLR